MDSTTRMRAITIRKLPATFGVKQRWDFLRDLKESMEVDRPRIVLDCSNVGHIDRTVVHLLLHCLEEAMKRNGDVKLAAVPHGAQAILELTGVKRLFEVFDTTDEAVKSFHQLPVYSIPQTFLPTLAPQESESAA
jgi:anti-sigma B factor antagonist